MNVDVDKIKDRFLRRIEDRYNQEIYFIESCFGKEDKYSRRIKIKDLSLEILFNNTPKDCKKIELTKLTEL